MRRREPCGAFGGWKSFPAEGGSGAGKAGVFGDREKASVAGAP